MDLSFQYKLPGVAAVVLLLLLQSLQSPVMSEPVPAPQFVHPYETYTNKTIDQIITNSLGGTNPAANQIMDYGENILAELDMFLTKDQFLNMYQPPNPDEMFQMGMMPAPLGTVYDEQRHNFFAPTPTSSADRRNKRGVSSSNSKTADADTISDADTLTKAHSKTVSGDVNLNNMDPQMKNKNDKKKILLGRGKRKAAKDVTLRWTKAIMPYKFAQGHFDGKEEYMMRRSMTEWERYTCMSFRPSISSDSNSVHFQNGIGCNSQLGMVGGIQLLNLQAPGCRFKGLYLHEIGHALGLVHEHQLPDRDNHIRIMYRNVSPNMRIWFNKYTNAQVDQMDVKYQLSSVMHYGITAFSKDGKSQTIQALDRNKEDTIGRVYLKELAYTDVEVVNKMYHCADHCADKTKCGPKGHLDQNCNCICEDGSKDCDRNIRETDRGCKNLYDSWSCYIWANQGECDRNSFYMHKYCSKACHKCGTQNDQAPQAAETWPWQWFPAFVNMMPVDWMLLGACKDAYKESRCQMWKSRGDCVTNPAWMTRNCKATCNLCSGTKRPEVECADAHNEPEKCQKWALEGECIVNPNFMYKNCRKSCQLCDKDQTDIGGSTGGTDEDKLECKDTHKNCGVWSKSGECESNPDWMIANCRKSCDKCDDGKCKNLYDDTKCEIWEQKKECLSNRDWMSRHCAKQCKTNACTGSTTTGSGEDKTDVTPRSGSRTTARPKITTNLPANCKNRHNSDKQCEIWAKNDHCSINPSWMLVNCAKACGKCSSTTDTRTTSTTTVASRVTTDAVDRSVPACDDTNDQCSNWAKHGFCDKNPRYNLIHCKKSCNNCNGCRDEEILCSVWADAGHCSRNARFMLRKCQKSCTACKT